MKAKHTPTPWELFNKGGIVSIYKNNKEVIKWTGFDASDYPNDVVANAAFIVQAVNAHEALVKALKEVLTTINQSEEWWIDCPSRGGFDTDKIEAALALVGAKELEYES